MREANEVYEAVVSTGATQTSARCCEILFGSAMNIVHYFEAIYNGYYSTTWQPMDCVIGVRKTGQY